MHPRSSSTLHWGNHQNEFPEFQTPPLKANVLLSTFLLNLTLCMTKLGILNLSFPDFTDISIMWQEITETRVPPNSWKVLSRLFCIFCDGTCLFYVFLLSYHFLSVCLFWVCTYKWRYLILRNSEMNILKIIIIIIGYTLNNFITHVTIS
jgi:hypothetical protein